jgi:hypothetical protein
MAIITRKNVPIEVGALEIFFNGLGASLIDVNIFEGNLVIDVNDDFTITFDFTNNKITVGSEDVTYIDTAAGPYTITVGHSDTIFYLQLNDSYSSGRRFGFIYEIINNSLLYAYKGTGMTSTTVAAFYPISDFTFTDIESLLNYTHGKRINGSVTVGYLMFAEDVLFNEGVRAMADSNFISCSTITADNVVTFNSQNYYAVGPNTLLLMENIIS